MSEGPTATGTTQPITPAEADKIKSDTIPGAVIEAFNELIAANWNGRTAVVYLDDAVEALTGKLDCTKDELHANRWLDVEASYTLMGWKVEWVKDYRGSFYRFTRDDGPP